MSNSNSDPQSGPGPGSGLKPRKRRPALLRRQSSYAPRRQALTFPAFVKYVRALSRSMDNIHNAWEGMRAQLELDPDEILVRTEEFVTIEVAATVYVCTSLRVCTSAVYFTWP